MDIVVFFSENGAPETGLSPIIDIVTVSGVTRVMDQDMAELAFGWYKYNFSDYDPDETYCIVADAGSDLLGAERYKYMVTDKAARVFSL